MEAQQPVQVNVGLLVQDAGALAKQYNRRLGATWTRDNTLAVNLFAGTAAEKQKQKQKKPVFETAPEDNVVFTYEYAHMHPSRLRFVHNTAALFHSLTLYVEEAAQAAGSAMSTSNKLDEDDALSPELKLRFSQLYRTRMEQQIRFLEAEKQPNTHGETQLFRHMLAAWHLAEIVFVAVPDSFAVNYIVWLAHNFSIDGAVVASHPKWAPNNEDAWALLYRLLLRGDSVSAYKLLDKVECTAQERTNVVDALQDMIGIMRPRDPSKKEDEFYREWKDSQAQVKKTLGAVTRGTGLLAQKSVEILQFLLGDADTIKSVCEKVGSSWTELLAAKVLFVDPLLQSYDVVDQIDDLKALQATTLGDFDKLCLFLFDLNAVEALNAASSMDLWFVTHLADFWSKCGVFKLTMSAPSLHYRDYFVGDYGKWLMSQSNLWQVGAQYLLTVPNGKAFVEAYIDNQPIDTQATAEKLLDLCADLKLDQELTICLHQKLARRALDNKQFGVALAHYDAAGDTHKVSYLADQMLKKYWDDGVLDLVEVADSLGHAAFESDRLAFLGHYAQFHELYKAKRFGKAGRLLVDLLTKAVAPKYFWPVLLMDSIPLLEDTQIIFSVDDTYELMRCLEECYSPAWTALTQGPPTSAASSSKGIHVSTDQLAVVQLALVRNLARASIAGNPSTGFGPLALTSSSNPWVA